MKSFWLQPELISFGNSMQKKSGTTRELIQQLQAIALQTGDYFALSKRELINKIESSGKMNPGNLLKYHDCLLAMLAYPENKELKVQVYAAIQKIAETLNGNYDSKCRLDGSGFAGTTITCSFSFAIAKWLTKNFPADTEIHSSHADAESVRLFFREILPRTEYESIFSGELSLLSRIKMIKGKSTGSSLNWLVHHIENSPLAERDKESVFHNLQVFITWKLNHPLFNRSLLQFYSGKIFYHSEIIRRPDIKKIITKKLPTPKKITAEEKKYLINIARSILAFLYRETEPFTYADENEITCFELERGLTIVLYGMTSERRLSIESYIGYLALKNGIPVAYGGGWIFGTRCQFGINILPPFRGGESSLLLANLLRVYKQQFGIRCFAVKPYQFGKNNLEALQSGAFWFYYKHGFRPDRKDLQKLADEEWGKKAVNKKYRTSIDLLKKFTSSNLVLQLTKSFYPDFDAAKISAAITRFINEKFNGDRKIAVVECLEKTKAALKIKTLSNWDKYEIQALEEWSLLSQTCLDLNNWKNQDVNQFVKLIRTKGKGPEISFIRQLQSSRRFWIDLAKNI